MQCFVLAVVAAQVTSVQFRETGHGRNIREMNGEKQKRTKLDTQTWDADGTPA
jgi:hypothetical protein